ncbi:Hypothetical protein Eab7_2274 [Exiguobacterium antarcticum B7]|nr:Hypothetical protein Eab7_2274 [Exiguobacterium antarcticum B7]
MGAERIGLVGFIWIFIDEPPFLKNSSSYYISAQTKKD